MTKEIIFKRAKFFAFVDEDGNNIFNKYFYNEQSAKTYAKHSHLKGTLAIVSMPIYKAEERKI
jgi:hypothetical protein